MSNKKDDVSFFDGAWLSSIIAFFATWVTAIVLFNFFGLVLGWIPALIVAAVVWFTFPFLYAIIFSLIIGCVVFFGILYFL
ncbi:hypothetical protein [Moraxella bovis]|uniref:hypothetical protein n=1 Tax=Moraxella bovis TaxID=476 RepID=UPI0009938233|nr:hypothetical protein [Moraxella bovis]OOR87964.1 hypothetical protein B0182_11120 [Moraxella bovis]